MPETTSPTSATMASASTRRRLRRWKSAPGPRGSKRAQRPAADRSSSVLREGIPDAPHRPDVAGLRRIGLDLVPDVADVDVDGALVLLQRVVVVADQLEQLRSRVHAARPRGKVTEQVELGRGQTDALAVTRHPPALEVDDEVLAPEGAAGLCIGQLAIGATQEGLDARHQLLDAERLDQVVIGPHLEPDDLVHLVRAGSQEQDRRTRLAAELAEHQIG